MSDTKRIRYSGKGGAVIQNQFGVWDAFEEKSDSPFYPEKDVPSALAERMIGEGQFEAVAPIAVVARAKKNAEPES